MSEGTAGDTEPSLPAALLEGNPEYSGLLWLRQFLFSNKFMPESVWRVAKAQENIVE